MDLQEEKKWILERNTEYRLGRPTVSDPTYDARLAKFRETYPDDELSKTAIFKLVDIDADNVETSNDLGKNKAILPITMRSLDKLHSIEDIQKWLLSNGLPLNTELVVSGKYDGISLCKDEEESSDNNTYTSGDGIIGRIATEHFKHINGANFFTSLSADEKNIFSYGEAIMPKKNWLESYEGKINPKSGELYKSARNTVGGMFNTDTPEPANLQNVVYIRYGMVSKEDEMLTKVQILDRLNQLNTIEVPYVIVTADDPTLYDTLNTLYTNWSVDFNIDGLVLDINDASIREQLGYEKNTNPVWARAYKNPAWAEVKNTSVISLYLGVSKQGNLNPVINIDPVSIGGATISNITGNNMRYVYDNHIIVGCDINLIRSGDVIPKHLETTNYDSEMYKKYWDELKYCPCCGKELVWNETKVNLVCMNKQCSGIMLSKLLFFFSSLEIDDFGEGEISKLFISGYQTPEQILNITYDDLILMNGWADKSITKLLSQFNKFKTIGFPLANIMQALDLFDGKIGKTIAQKILDEYDGDFNSDDIINKLCNISGVQEISASAFLKGYTDYFKNYSTLPVAVSYIKTPVKDKLGDKFNGFSVCMTGFRDKKMEDMIKAYGGKIVSGVSKKTTHLVVADMNSGSSKIDKAISLKSDGVNISIMTKEDFLEL